MGWAVQAGDRDKCRDLVKGATGWAPLALAAQRDDLETVRFLVNNVIAVIDRKDVEYKNDEDNEEEGDGDGDDGDADLDGDDDGSSYSLHKRISMLGTMMGARQSCTQLGMGT